MSTPTTYVGEVTTSSVMVSLVKAGLILGFIAGIIITAFFGVALVAYFQTGAVQTARPGTEYVLGGFLAMGLFLTFTCPFIMGTMSANPTVRDKL